ncbi:MAG TPA: T9SS type A sorting domain-containing protein [Bacteroidia bacterium]|nr:T9SS type A sorting domain-containing protein [Bacteroidia bacterium]
MRKIYFNTKLILLTVLLGLVYLGESQTNVVLGSGTTAHTSTDAGPINEYYRSLHAQTVYTAAELNAAGVFSGTITKLGFYVVSGVTNPLPNYTIKLKHTTALNAATYDGTGLTTVYNNTSYNPTAGGFDMLTFSTLFNWNGVDNILVDVCFDQVSAYTSTGIVRVYNTAVTNGYIYIRDDSAPQCGLACNSTLNSKPQVQLEFLPPAPLDLGISAFVKPLGSKKCFGPDTVIATLKNYGSATADFSVNQTTITVNTTGPNATTFSLALTSGTLATNATQNFTLSTNFNLGNMGTYKFKGYTSVTGDGSALNDTVRLTINKVPLFTTSIAPNDSVCLGVPIQLNTNFSSVKQVGNGTNTQGGSGLSPYAQLWEGQRTQYLFKASELTVAGLSPGNINALAFDVTSASATMAFTNYSIKMYHTNSSDLATAYASASSAVINVFGPINLPAPTVGINTHTFTTPFNWDGISNVIVDICFENDPSNTGTFYTSNSIVAANTVSGYTSVRGDYADNSSLCNTSNTGSSTTSNIRPNILFEQPATITYSWSPAIELSASNISNPIANVTSTRTYTVEGTVAGCMTHDTVRIFIKPTPTPNLGNDSLFCNLPVVINANTSANSYLWNNGTVGSSLNVTTPGKYWVRATNSNGCSNSDTVLVSLGQSPIVTLGPDTAYCQGSTINLYAGAGTGNSYLWSTGSTASSISVGTSGTYSVVVTNTIGCKSSDVINITSKPKPSVSLVFVGTHTYCVTENITRTLTEGVPANGTYIGAGVTGTNFNPSQAGQGNHIILYTIVGANGCSNTAKDTMIVSACVGVNELSSEDIGMSVYPNPNSGIFTIELNTNESLNGSLSITSVDGRLVYTELITGNGIITKSINIAHLAEGIYYLKVETKDAVRTYKVLKQ